MTTYDMDSLQSFQPTVTSLPYPGEQDSGDMPVVTVQAKFDWKFWLGVLAMGYAGYLLLKSMGRAARHG